MDFSTVTTGTTNMNPPEFTVDDLDEVRRLSMVILGDMTRIAVDEKNEVYGLDEEEVGILSGILGTQVGFVSGNGPLPQCVQAFTHQIRRSDGNVSNIAECVPYSRRGTPEKFIAPTAFDVVSNMLLSLSWEFFTTSVVGVRKAFSEIVFDWDEILRLNARMEREVSILPQQFGAQAGAAQASGAGAQQSAGAATGAQQFGATAGAAQAGAQATAEAEHEAAGAQHVGATGATATPERSDPLLVTYLDFQNITKTQLSSGRFNGGVARSTLYKKLPALHQPTQTAGREKLWRYEDVAAAWNRARNRPAVPDTEEAARAMLRDPKRVQGR